MGFWFGECIPSSPRVLIMTGDEEREVGSPCRFSEEAYRFANYLNEVLGYEPSRMDVLLQLGADQMRESMAEFFARAMRGKSRPALIIYYAGHGLKGWICPWAAFVHYDELADRLARYDGEFVFINDSCSSGSAVPVFQRWGLLDRGLVLAASRSNEQSSGRYFIDAFLWSVSHGQPFKRRAIAEIERHGSELVYFANEGVCEVIRICADGLPLYNPRPVSFAPKRHPVVVQNEIQHPVRAGRSLDYLLFPSR